MPVQTEVARGKEGHRRNLTGIHAATSGAAHKYPRLSGLDIYSLSCHITDVHRYPVFYKRERLTVRIRRQVLVGPNLNAKMNGWNTRTVPWCMRQSLSVARAIIMLPSDTGRPVVQAPPLSVPAL